MIALIAYSALSFLLIGFYRWFALRYRWLDIPNQRSSHSVITPRGAGIIFAILIIAAALFTNHQRIFLPLLLIGIAIALIGWWDDIRGTSPQGRFALYIALTGTAVILIFINSDIPKPNLTLTIICGLFITLALTWLINLYNFMDGVNGLAALQAIFVLLGINLLAKGSPYGEIFSPLHSFSCAALLGFLAWNFPLGKVFMGDAGSAFLGFFLGVLMLLSFTLAGPGPVVWLILLAIFITDTGYTLLVRFATGQKWYEGHRLHSYQQLTGYLSGSHSRTAIILMSVNLCWLFPIAWLVQTKILKSLPGFILAYLPLLITCYLLKAGIPRSREV